MKRIPSHILFIIAVLLFSISVTVYNNIQYSNMHRVITIASLTRPEIQSVCLVSLIDNNYMSYLCTGYDIILVEIYKNSTKNNTVSMFSKVKNVSLWIIADSKQHFGIISETKISESGILLKSGIYKFTITRKDWWNVKYDNHIDKYINNGKRYSETNFVTIYNNSNALVL